MKFGESENPDSCFHVAAGYQPLMRMLGLDAAAVFDHEEIVCWRKLPDRENCTIDAELPDGRNVRLHVKRYPTRLPAEHEALGHKLLIDAGIPTSPLVGWGGHGGRGFVIFDDLRGYRPADKLIGAGTPFDLLLAPTADLAALLHNQGLHHRDLYLCHFMADAANPSSGMKLIDPARVHRLPGPLTRGRWIVKDLAQFWYSTLKLPITEAQRDAWLRRYCEKRGIVRPGPLRRRIEWKTRSIARHDARLHRARPERDVSIPT